MDRCEIFYAGCPAWYCQSELMSNLHHTVTSIENQINHCRG
jgi:hypothetical protein